MTRVSDGRGRGALIVVALLSALVLVSAPGAAASGPDRDASAKGTAPGGTRGHRIDRIKWDAVGREATELLSKYIRINTTNPPGNEIRAARMLKQKLQAEGIKATVWEPAPGRGVVAARLRGRRTRRKAIILLSHMDVVPANPSEWKVGPFSGRVKDGEIWGRGALDDKGPGIVSLMAMIALNRAGIALDRDVIFVATAGEERGGKIGAGWFVRHHGDYFSDAGFVLNEGGGIQVRRDGRKIYRVSVAEKTPFWIRLTAHGPAGHAAVPRRPTAVSRLVRALDRLIAYSSPIRVVPPVESYFHALALIDHGNRKWLDLAGSMKDAAFRRAFVASPGRNALVRNTITPTVLSAGRKTNVVPAQAYAEVDCRLLPGTDREAFLSTIREIIADDTIKVKVMLNFPPASSPAKSELMTAIEELARREGNAVVVPAMLAGFTDSHYFRERNLVAYGFVPLQAREGEVRGVHGRNERISVAELGRGIRRMVELLVILSAPE